MCFIVLLRLPFFHIFGGIDFGLVNSNSGSLFLRLFFESVKSEVEKWYLGSLISYSHKSDSCPTLLNVRKTMTSLIVTGIILFLIAIVFAWDWFDKHRC